MSAGYDGRVIIWDVSPFKDPSLCFPQLSYDLLFTQSGDFFFGKLSNVAGSYGFA